MSFRRRILWSAFLVAFVGVAGALAWLFLREDGRGGASGNVPVYFTLPDFSLTGRSGRLVRRADLLGKVWVADFFYTQCKDTCPLQTAEMARLQVDFPSEKDFLLVSITIDPEHDTPEVLASYAKRFGANPDRWLFLTGEKEAIYHLALKGFHLSVADPDKRQGQGPTSRAAPIGEALWSPMRARVGHMDAGIAPIVFLRALLSIFEPASAWAHHPGSVKLFIHSSRFALVDRKADIRGYYHSDDPASLRRLRRDVRTLLAQN